METANVVVVGSLNMDLVVAVERHPKPGETVIGGDLQRFPGGKGANQAVAAARLGARVRMIGRVGADAYGAELKRGLAAEGIEIADVAEIEAPTGVALISVSEDGQNAIIVSPGANARLRPDDLNPTQFVNAEAVVLQLETPLATVQRAAEAVYSTAGQAQIRELVQGYLENADLIARVMDELGFHYVGGDNSPYIWVLAERDSWEFFDLLLDRAGVVCTPGAGFGKCGQGYIRLSAFNSHENVEKAMERIRLALG